MKPAWEYAPVNDAVQPPRISVVTAESDERIVQQASEARRTYQRLKGQYLVIAEMLCRGDRRGATRVHSDAIRGANDVPSIVTRYFQLVAAGDSAPVGQIVRETRDSEPTVHRKLKKGIQSGRWPELVGCYPRRAGMRRPTVENGK